MKFLSCKEEMLGLYPIVYSSSKLETLYKLGVKTAQLRIKDKQGTALEAEIEKAIALSEKYGVQFFVNDHWLLAIQYGAYGVHLGQEDLQDADLNAIHKANLRLGISTHTPKEMELALEIQPSYVAIGPIFETTSKQLEYAQVKLEELKQRSYSSRYPIVVIGGINEQNIDPLLTMEGVQGFAVISAVLNEQGEICHQKTQTLIDKINYTHAH